MYYLGRTMLHSTNSRTEKSESNFFLFVQCDMQLLSSLSYLCSLRSALARNTFIILIF